MRDQWTFINRRNILLGSSFVFIFFFGFYLGSTTKTYPAPQITPISEEDTTNSEEEKGDEKEKENENENEDEAEDEEVIVFLPPLASGVSPPDINVVDLEEVESTFSSTYQKAGISLEKWKHLKGGEKWQYQAHESALNVGHFFLEHWPNLYHFGGNMGRFCYQDGMFGSVKALVNTFFPHIHIEESDECDESNSPIYSCFMSWSCKGDRQHLLLSHSEMWEAYEALFKHCDVRTVGEEIDILLMNRDGKNNRRVLSYDKLIPFLTTRELTYATLESPQINEMSQCQLFREYAKARMVILPYGADLLYPLLLSKRTVALVHKITSEGFWDTSRHQLARFSPYKALSVNGKTSHDISNSVGYYYYSSNVYHGNDLELSTENMDDLLDIIDAMFKI